MRKPVVGPVLGRLIDAQGDASEFALVELHQQFAKADHSTPRREVDPLKDVVDAFVPLEKLLKLLFGNRAVAEMLHRQLEELAHRMYASADFLLMPSRVEPCGLNQLYALRYGTVPIVHKTGGLKDTVIDLENKDGYGLTFDNLSTECLIQAIGRALDLHSDQEKLTKARKKMMALDFSWDQSSKEYIKLYKNILSG